ncbi:MULTISPECIES: helix-turn-helix transcriptional regulator [unclassified Streptomyces]|uniref:ArsR/SmtB family transcription factor n=1 Tax=unclassified Streptomyces TaxID=2593676 RepID=UPI0011E7330D|nr:metalloregulator ArsR/SmtB family transcription factor [Streptomyces sp. sk2.1]TXS68155.1 ArsR family transcriptional regulator [Streptomyces sp. sk2.1]
MTADDRGALGGAPDKTLEQTAATFGLLASPARLRILQALAQGETNVTDLLDQVGGAPSTISQHLAALKRAGLVGARRDGRRQVYFIEAPATLTVIRLVAEQLSAQPAPAIAPCRSAP